MSAQCDDVRERLAAGDETGAPDLAARAQVAEHLATCDACRAVAASLLEVDDALTSMPVVMPPEALSRAVIERVLAESAARGVDAAPVVQRDAVPQPVSGAGDDVRSDAAVPAGRLAIAALIAAIVALLEAPFALVRWLATPRRAVLTLGTGAVGAAGAMLMLTLSRDAVPRERVEGADGMLRTLEVATPTTTETTTARAEGSRHGYFDQTVADTMGDVVQLAQGSDHSGLDPGAFDWQEGELGSEDGRFAFEGAISAGEPSASSVVDDLSPEEAELDEETHRQLEALGSYSRLDRGDQARDGERAQPTDILANLDDDGDVAVAEQAQRPRPSARDTAWQVGLERTEGLAFRSRRGWWENTYVPGDPALRVLHRRLAASSGAAIAGTSLSALALAELATPAQPAISVPRDAAVALGVQADVRAVEGTRRVRVEVGMRAMERAAGRRDPMRIAVVIDARGDLRERAEANVRTVLDALGRARGARDRIAIYAAGDGGGEILALGALRHGEVEVALRRLFSAQETVGESLSLGDALGAAITSAGSGEGAGLVLLLTPGGVSDASVESALHAGALAGVPTTAVAIDDAASLADLDAIALAGQGRRRSVASAEDADRAVRGELDAASRIVARALRLELRLGAGVELVDVIGSRSLDAARTARAREAERTVDRELAASLGIASDRGDDDDGLVIYLPAFHAGASHTVLLDLVVRGPGAVVEVDLRYKDLVRLRNGRATDALSLSRGRPSRGPAELRVVSRLLGAELASALAEAGDRLAAGDASGARARIEQARERILAACDATPGLASERVVIAELALAERYLAALSSEPSPLLAASMRYAARRHAVVPQSDSDRP